VSLPVRPIAVRVERIVSDAVSRRLAEQRQREKWIRSIVGV
jgi:hypothetical protein